MKGKRARDNVKFGEVNKLPPQNLHKLGAELFGDKTKKAVKVGRTAEALAKQRSAAKMKANYAKVKSNRRERTREKSNKH